MERRNIDAETLEREEWNSLLNNYDKHDVGEAYFTGRAHEMGLQVEHWGIDMRHDDDGLVFDNKMDLRLWEPANEQDSPSTWPSDVLDIDGVESSNTPSSWFRHTADDYETYSESASGADGQTDEWQLRAVCDVKTKANDSWMGVFNLRHYAHYAHWADAYDVPVFVYFTPVDMDDEVVGETNALVPMTTDWNYERVSRHFDPDDPTRLDWETLKETATDSTIINRVFEAPDRNPVVAVNEGEWRTFNWLRDALRSHGKV